MKLFSVHDFEKEKDKVIFYGLVFNNNSFNPTIPVKISYHYPNTILDVVNKDEKNIRLYSYMSKIFILDENEIKIFTSLNDVAKKYNINIFDNFYRCYFINKEKIGYNIINSDNYYLKAGDYNYVVRVPNSPTDNCQLFSIASFQSVLGFGEDKIKTFLYNIYSIFKKPLLFIDINRENITKVEKLFGSKIISKSEYYSSNHSNMCTMIINIKKFIDVDDEQIVLTKEYSKYEYNSVIDWNEKYE